MAEVWLSGNWLSRMLAAALRVPCVRKADQPADADMRGTVVDVLAVLLKGHRMSSSVYYAFNLDRSRSGS